MITNVDRSVHVPEATIPVLRADAYRTAYSPPENRLYLEGKKTSDEVFSSPFRDFDTFVESYNSKGKDHPAFKMREILPDALKMSFFVFEHMGLEMNSAPIVSIVAHPSELSELVSFFEEYLGNPDNARTFDNLTMYQIRSFLREFREMQNSGQNASMLDQRLEATISDSKKTIWEVFVEETKKPQEKVVKEYSRRVFIHESIHYVSMRNKWHGVIGQVLENAARVVNSLNIDYEHKKESEDRFAPEKFAKSGRLVKLTKLIKATLESEAIIHEVLGTAIVENTRSYSHFYFCKRLLSVLKLYTDAEPEKLGDEKTKLDIDIVLDADDVLDEHRSPLFKEHDIGTLLILFAQEINIGEFTRSLDFSQLAKSKNGDLPATITQRIEEIAKNPEEALATVTSSYDFIQEMLRALVSKFNEEFMQLFIEYPEISKDLSSTPVGSRETYISKAQKFTAFLQHTQATLFEDPIFILPIEAKRKVNSPILKKLRDLFKGISFPKWK